MKTVTSDNPAARAGEHISKLINEHDGDVLCFLSGGSALEVVARMNIHKKSECRTIYCMGDERGSREPKINNYLQLKSLHPEHQVTESTLDTTPYENESLEKFSLRIETEIKNNISESNNLLVIHIIGVGTDGHTAGIFPMKKESFEETYTEDRMYVPVHAEGLKIDSRASLTPSWILNHADYLIGYMAGESKKSIIKSLINESKDLHERPAELLKLHRNAVIYTDQEIV